MAELSETAQGMEDDSKTRTTHVGSGLGGTSQAMIDRSGQARAHGPKKSTTAGADRISVQEQIGSVEPYLSEAMPGHTSNSLGDQSDIKG